MCRQFRSAKMIAPSRRAVPCRKSPGAGANNGKATAPGLRAGWICRQRRDLGDWGSLWQDEARKLETRNAKLQRSSKSQPPTVEEPHLGGLLLHRTKDLLP